MKKRKLFVKNVTLKPWDIVQIDRNVFTWTVTQVWLTAFNHITRVTSDAVVCDGYKIVPLEDIILRYRPRWIDKNLRWIILLWIVIFSFWLAAIKVYFDSNTL